MQDMVLAHARLTGAEDLHTGALAPAKEENDMGSTPRYGRLQAAGSAGMAGALASFDTAAGIVCEACQHAADGSPLQGAGGMLSSSACMPGGGVGSWKSTSTSASITALGTSPRLPHIPGQAGSSVSHIASDTYELCIY